jgi:hypothetical protein
MQKRNIVFGGGAIAALLAFIVGLPLYAAFEDMTADYGRSVAFVPLVRHMMSQVHCYDTGTEDCEGTRHLGSSFTKEHTLGFLLDGSRKKMQQRGFEELYICEARDDSHTMMVTSGVADDNPRDACRDADYRPRRAGYISSTTDIEAPWALYRCIHEETHDTLLTDDPGECTSQNYNPAELLGYLYAGGPQTLD